jgi:hypothetical protein
LAETLPSVIARGARAADLVAYERAWRREFALYATLTESVLALSRRPRLRRWVLGGLSRVPGVLGRLLDVTVGTPRS